MGNAEKEASMSWRLVVDAEVNVYFASYSEGSEDACEILQNIGKCSNEYLRNEIKL